MSRRTSMRRRAAARALQPSSFFCKPVIFESVEPRRLLSSVGIASGQVSWVPATTSALEASGGASGADPGATGSGSTGTGTTGPGTVVSPGNGTAVGATFHADAGVAFSGEVGLLKDVTLPTGM
jgi:hypothetical protein